MILDVMAIILVILGLVFFLGTVIGILRFPDYYTRIHAAGKGDTLSSLLILLGLIVYNFHDFSFASLLVSAKIALIFGFIFLTAPTTTHALMEAGYRYGAKPWMSPQDQEAQEETYRELPEESA